MTRAASSAPQQSALLPDARVWRADARSIAYRDWDDDLVVFNETTGHTHQLGPLGRAVLLALLARPAGLRISDIVLSLTDAADQAEAAVLAIERTLGELADLELVACIPN